MRLSNISKIVNNISESMDKDTALKNENSFYAILLSSTIAFGALAHFCVQYFLFGESFTSVTRGSIILVLFSLIALGLKRLKNEVIKMYLFSVEVSLIFLFIYYEFISFIGPAVVLAGLFLLVTLLIYSRLEIIIIYFISFITVILTSDINLYTFENWNSYFVAQIIILIVILVTVLFVYKVYKSRQDKIEKLYAEILLSEEKLEYLSYRDYLTGLYNRRYYEKILIEVDTKENLPLSFVFADVNNLKKFNDNFGHAAGDDLIKLVARNLHEGCREGDVLARIGGDEFIMILPKSSYMAAKQILDRIRSNIESQKLENRNVSVAFGIATKEFEHEDEIKILNKAEENMYIEKRNQHKLSIN